MLWEHFTLYVQQRLLTSPELVNYNAKTVRLDTFGEESDALCKERIYFPWRNG